MTNLEFRAFCLSLKADADYLKEKAPGRAVDFLHGAVGLIGEAVELSEGIRKGDLLNIKEELGDCLHYLVYCEEAGQALVYDPPVAITPHNDTRTLITQSAHLLDQAKKWFVYGRQPLDVIKPLVIIISELDAISAYYNLTLVGCREHNIEKLKRRYPNGVFSEEAALKRRDKG